VRANDPHTASDGNGGRVIRLSRLQASGHPLSLACEAPFDPALHNDWKAELEVDLAASREANQPVLWLRGSGQSADAHVRSSVAPGFQRNPFLRLCTGKERVKYPAELPMTVRCRGKGSAVS
jgi:hypothetical protein